MLDSFTDGPIAGAFCRWLTDFGLPVESRNCCRVSRSQRLQNRACAGGAMVARSDPIVSAWGPHRRVEDVVMRFARQG